MHHIAAWAMLCACVHIKKVYIGCYFTYYSYIFRNNKTIGRHVCRVTKRDTLSLRQSSGDMRGAARFAASGFGITCSCPVSAHTPFCQCSLWLEKSFTRCTSSTSSCALSSPPCRVVLYAPRRRTICSPYVYPRPLRRSTAVGSTASIPLSSSCPFRAASSIALSSRRTF